MNEWAGGCGKWGDGPPLLFIGGFFKIKGGGGWFCISDMAGKKTM